MLYLQPPWTSRAKQCLRLVPRVLKQRLRVLNQKPSVLKEQLRRMFAPCRRRSALPLLRLLTGDGNDGADESGDCGELMTPQSE